MDSDYFLISMPPEEGASSSPANSSAPERRKQASRRTSHRNNTYEDLFPADKTTEIFQTIHPTATLASTYAFIHNSNASAEPSSKSSPASPRMYLIHRIVDPDPAGDGSTAATPVSSTKSTEEASSELPPWVQVCC